MSNEKFFEDDANFDTVMRFPFSQRHKRNLFWMSSGIIIFFFW